MIQEMELNKPFRTSDRKQSGKKVVLKQHAENGSRKMMCFGRVIKDSSKWLEAGC